MQNKTALAPTSSEVNRHVSTQLYIYISPRLNGHFPGQYQNVSILDSIRAKGGERGRQLEP